VWRDIQVERRKLSLRWSLRDKFGRELITRGASRKTVMSREGSFKEDCGGT